MSSSLVTRIRRFAAGTPVVTTEQGVISRVRLDDGGARWQASLG